MDPITGAAIIGGGSALIGGIMGNQAQAEAAANNVKYQKQFAKQGIQWKVKDAKKAGIAPEYALGASTQSFSPTFTGNSPVGDAISDAGQNVARSVLATSTKEDRQFDQLIKAETLRGMKLDNDLRATQMTTVNRPGNPPFPSARGNVIEGQGNSPVKDVQLERTGMSKSAPYSEGGSIPAVGWAQTPDGGLRPVPSQDIKNRIEDQLIPETVWAAQNLVAPNFGKGPRPPAEALPKGAKHWRWSVSRQAWYPQKARRNFGDTAYEWYEGVKDRWNKPIPRRR